MGLGVGVRRGGEAVGDTEGGARSMPLLRWRGGGDGGGEGSATLLPAPEPPRHHQVLLLPLRPPPRLPVPPVLIPLPIFRSQASTFIELVYAFMVYLAKYSVDLFLLIYQLRFSLQMGNWNLADLLEEMIIDKRNSHEIKGMPLMMDFFFIK